MNIFLKSIVEGLVVRGDLTVTGPDGVDHRFGDGTGAPLHVGIATPHAERAIALDPTLALPEAYMDGDLVMRSGDIRDLLHLAYRNMGPSGSIEAMWTRAVEGVRYALRRVHQYNPESRSRRNVAHHYDLSNDFYRLFLDEDMQYSCAYFERPEMSLDAAQDAKKRHIMDKLRLADGQCVLDIGCGWGGMALSIARRVQADILGVTLSTEQHALATSRAQQEGLDGHVHFELRDYRDLQQRFDRIVSVGMFEHVGVNHYRAFYEKCAALLKPDGVMVLHTIGRSGPPAATNPFIRKHIFPGGYIPALSEVLPAIEKAGLIVTDIEVLRQHYAETLRHWRERLHANRQRVLAMYDERFFRMWDFYLAGSEAAFRWQDMVVFQIQLAARNDALPLTRDYMGEAAKRPKQRKDRSRAKERERG